MVHRFRLRLPSLLDGRSPGQRHLGGILGGSIAVEVTARFPPLSGTHISCSVEWDAARTGSSWIRRVSFQRLHSLSRDEASEYAGGSHCGQRVTWGDPFAMSASTSASEAMEVSPGVVMTRAPWAVP